MQAFMSPQGEEAETARAEAANRLRELQNQGIFLALNMECPAEADPENLAAEIGPTLELFKTHGLNIKITLSGENGEAVEEHLRAAGHDDVLDFEGMDQEGIHNDPEMANMLLGMVMNPQGENEEEAAAQAQEALEQLHQMQDMGIFPEISFDCPADHPPEQQAEEINGMLMHLESNGVAVIPNLTGVNAEKVGELIGHIEDFGE
jgi:hypothetical protein